MTWGFIWMIVVLKIPIAALLWLVWWAVHAEPEPAADEQSGGDGGVTGSFVPAWEDVLSLCLPWGLRWPRPRP